MNKKTYIIPRTKIQEIENEMLLANSRAMNGLFDSQATRDYVSDSNERYDYEEDDEDLW